VGGEGAAAEGEEVADLLDEACQAAILKSSPIAVWCSKWTRTLNFENFFFSPVFAHGGAAIRLFKPC